MNPERRAILYGKVRRHLKNKGKSIKFKVPVNFEESEYLSEALDTLAGNEFERYREKQSEVWCERYDSDVPIAVLPMRIDAFFSFIDSDKWSNYSSLRITEGPLLNKLLEVIFLLEEKGTVTRYVSTIYGKHQRTKKLSALKTSTKNENIALQETLKVSFIHYVVPKWKRERSLQQATYYQTCFSSIDYLSIHTPSPINSDDSARTENIMDDLDVIGRDLIGASMETCIGSELCYPSEDSDIDIISEEDEEFDESEDDIEIKPEDKNEEEKQKEKKIPAPKNAAVKRLKNSDSKIVLYNFSPYHGFYREEILELKFVPPVFTWDKHPPSPTSTSPVFNLPQKHKKSQICKSECPSGRTTRAEARRWLHGVNSETGSEASRNSFLRVFSQSVFDDDIGVKLKQIKETVTTPYVETVPDDNWVGDKKHVTKKNLKSVLKKTEKKQKKKHGKADKAVHNHENQYEETTVTPSTESPTSSSSASIRTRKKFSKKKLNIEKLDTGKLNKHYSFDMMSNSDGCSIDAEKNIDKLEDISEENEQERIKSAELRRIEQEKLDNQALESYFMKSDMKTVPFNPKKLFRNKEVTDFAEKCTELIKKFNIRKEQVTSDREFKTTTTITINRNLVDKYA